MVLVSVTQMDVELAFSPCRMVLRHLQLCAMLCLLIAIQWLMTVVPPLVYVMAARLDGQLMLALLLSAFSAPINVINVMALVHLVMRLVNVMQINVKLAMTTKRTAQLLPSFYVWQYQLAVQSSTLQQIQILQSVTTAQHPHVQKDIS